MLLEFGIPAHINGFDYIHRALELLQEDKETYMHLDRRPYPKLAEEFGVTKKAVEMGVYYAMETAFDSMDDETDHRFFGNSYECTLKPKQFLATLALHLKETRWTQ